MYRTHLTPEERTRYPLSCIERSQLDGVELDTSTPLGQALLSERWLNFCIDGQSYWLHRLRSGVIGCTLYISRTRGQVEVHIEMHPGETAIFCVTLAEMNRFY